MSASPVALRDATVVIVGLGLMGGSLGLAIDGACAHRIGVELDPEAAASAIGRGAVDEVLPLKAAAARADLLVLAVPVVRSLTAATAAASAMRPGSVLTDLGSTKAMVCDAYDALDVLAPTIGAVGGHPMCGRELSGIEHADEHLFRDAAWALVDTAAGNEHAHRIVGELVAATGARMVVIDRHSHDRAVAAVSHLPYAVAQSLVAMLPRADRRANGAASRLAATGFAGATRLVGGDVDMWRDVLVTNRDHVRESIADLQVELTRLADALDDPVRLERLLRAGRDAGAVRRTQS